jgi:hypothetical protein
LGEHQAGSLRVVGSNPSSSTIFKHSGKRRGAPAQIGVFLYTIILRDRTGPPLFYLRY